MQTCKPYTWWWRIGGRLGHYGNHPYPRVADSGTNKMVAPDKGVSRRQTVSRRRKLFDYKPGRRYATQYPGTIDKALHLPRVCMVSYQGNFQLRETGLGARRS